MPQFELEQPTPCVIVGVNPRSEMHGEVHVPAMDLDLRLTGSNDLLSLFDPSLKSMLYRQADEQAEGQIEIEAMEPVSDMPKLRCTILKPIKLTVEHVGYKLTVDRGLGGKSNLVVEGCGVKRFEADCKEGGSVELDFRVQAAHVDENVLGRLAVMIGSRVDVVLEAPRGDQMNVEAA